MANVIHIQDFKRAADWCRIQAAILADCNRIIAALEMDYPHSNDLSNAKYIRDSLLQSKRPADWWDLLYNFDAAALRRSNACPADGPMHVYDFPALRAETAAQLAASTNNSETQDKDCAFACTRCVY